MGREHPHDPVKLITAILYTGESVFLQAVEDLTALYGEQDLTLPPFPFTYTDYYTEEMGANLTKTFLSFQNLIAPEQLPDIKLATNAIEQKYAAEGGRQVNIDPGYISEAKLVLATTKNYSHRIYLGKGIFGDLHLQYHKGTFEPNPWTYPDYQSEQVIQFLTDVRKNYFTNLGTPPHTSFPEET